MNQQIRDKARELLEARTVSCVIGYERASDGISSRPAFVYEAKDVERLVFDKTCTHNLVRYLLARRAQSTAIVVKPCDSRAINLLLVEKQIERTVFIIGVVCPGMVEASWGKASDELEPACQHCRQRTPAIYDFLVGTPEEKVGPDLYADVAEMEAKPAAEREAFWEEQFKRCIRCYACRQVCPGCYCPECFAERLDPAWVGIKIAPAQNQVWHAIRALHLAGRCAGCQACERACPVGIPLSLLNRKLEKEVSGLFDFEAGMDDKTPPPFSTFKQDEVLEFGK